VPPADAGEWLGLDLLDEDDCPPPAALHSEFCEFCATAADADVEPTVEDEDVEDAAVPLFESCDETVPLISFDLTISCLASLVFVPGLVRLIFILRPLSTVAECSTAILPGLPALPWTAFTPLTFTPDACLLPGPVTIDAVPFVLPAPFALPVPFELPLPLPGLLERVDDEFTPQEEEDDDDEDDDEDDDNDDNEDDED
jgi:hypothetical protein